MANTFLTNDIVTFEALDVLENTDKVMQRINSEYSDQFDFGGTVLGQTLNIRKPPRYLGRLGQAAQIEAITETFVPLTLSYQRGIDTQVSSQNLALDIDNYRERVLKPQIVRLNNLIDQDVCNLAQGLNNSVGTPGTTPTTLTTYGLAKVKLDNNACPSEDRYAWLSPVADFTLMDNLKTLYNSGKAISAQYESGSMTESGTLGMAWDMDQNIYVQTVGALGSSTPVVGTAPANGATTISTTGWTTGTLNAGDTISFVSTTTPVNLVNPQNYQNMGSPMQFVVTATTSDSGGTMVIPFAPAMYGPGQQLQNVTNLPAVSTAVYVYDTPAASASQPRSTWSPTRTSARWPWSTCRCPAERTGHTEPRRRNPARRFAASAITWRPQTSGFSGWTCCMAPRCCGRNWRAKCAVRGREV
jgi:hypothetical protein